jgi:hypothetical protein
MRQALYLDRRLLFLEHINANLSDAETLESLENEEEHSV